MEEKKERKESRISTLYKKKEQLEEWKADANSIVKDLDEQLDRVNKRIWYIENRQVYITSHSLLRYQQRVDPTATEESMRREVLTPRVLNMIHILPNGVFPTDDDSIRLCIADKKVVTILTKDHEEH